MLTGNAFILKCKKVKDSVLQQEQSKGENNVHSTSCIVIIKLAKVHRAGYLLALQNKSMSVIYVIKQHKSNYLATLNPNNSQQ